MDKSKVEAAQVEIIQAQREKAHENTKKSKAWAKKRVLEEINAAKAAARV